MCLPIIWDLAKKSSKLSSLKVMMFETKDCSNVPLFICWVIDDIQEHEYFLVLYIIPSVDAVTLVAVIKDVFLRMNLSFSKVFGRCYEGTSAMSGIKSDVAKPIRCLELRAIFNHCYGNAQLGSQWHYQEIQINEGCFRNNR